MGQLKGRGFIGALIILILLVLSLDETSASTNNQNLDPIPDLRHSSVDRENGRRKDTVQAFQEDLYKLQHLHNQIPLLTPIVKKRDSSYIKSWKRADWEHHQVESLARYTRHLVKWILSPTARAIVPAVAGFVAWSCLVVFVMHRSPEMIDKASFAAGLGSFTAPLSLLLALKTNRALNRLLDTRKLLSQMFSATKSMAGLTATYVLPIDADKALLIGRYLAVYGWIMKGYFREEDVAPLIREVFPPEEVLWLESAPSDMPTIILARLRQLAASLITDLPRTASQALESRIWELESIFADLKRMFGNPLPPTYTRHTSRVLCLSLGLLPIALVGSNASFAAILVTMALLSYVFVGIDEISVEIEHPFPLIPMYYHANAAQNHVANQFILAVHQAPTHSQPVS